MLNSHSQELTALKALGFVISDSFEALGLEQVWQQARLIDSSKEAFDYFIDGMVVKLDDNILVQNLGHVGKTPRGWCAVKFAATEVATQVVGVSWQVGRTGKVTPIVELEPVELMQTVVARATLHNYQRFLDLSLAVGDWVVIRKAGEIIPEVVSKVR